MDIADNTDDEKEVKDESDPWARFRTEAAEKSLTEFEELWQNFSADDLEKNEAKDKAYLIILPKPRKDLQACLISVPSAVDRTNRERHNT